MLDIDAPTLSLSLPDELLVSTINISDDVVITCNYSKNSDYLTYSLILVY